MSTTISLSSETLFPNTAPSRGSVLFGLNRSFDLSTVNGPHRTDDFKKRIAETSADKEGDWLIGLVLTVTEKANEMPPKLAAILEELRQPLFLDCRTHTAATELKWVFDEASLNRIDTHFLMTEQGPGRQDVIVPLKFDGRNFLDVLVIHTLAMVPHLIDFFSHQRGAVPNQAEVVKGLRAGLALSQSFLNDARCRCVESEEQVGEWAMEVQNGSPYGRNLPDKWLALMNDQACVEALARYLFVLHSLSYIVSCTVENNGVGLQISLAIPIN